MKINTSGSNIVNAVKEINIPKVFFSYVYFIFLSFQTVLLWWSGTLIRGTALTFAEEGGSLLLAVMRPAPGFVRETHNSELGSLCKPRGKNWPH